MIRTKPLSKISAFPNSQIKFVDGAITHCCVDSLKPLARPPNRDFQFISANQGKGRPLMSSAAVKRIKKKIPERLAEIRGDRSQRRFARELGVFQQNINRYENGTTPHTDFLITLSIKENISIDWLLFGKGRMRKGR
ncbi:MAG TPA: helix-turn-helix domain-containing protein [Myxococcales bacterium]|nr:helix-turn-helix domain-containing protein [Myxococcales bacterium]HIK86843.1 helix-turn-helix domain-containing protein [Myxococcales bacterium]